MSNVAEKIFLKIIGVGSPIGDDDIGWRVIDTLSAAPWLQPWLGRGVELISLDRPGISLLEQMVDVSQGVVIDAMSSGRQPGAVARFEWPFSTQEAGLLSSHGFGVGDALCLGQALGTLPAKLWVWGVEIQSFAGGAGPGRWTQDQIAKILQPIENELQLIIDREIVKPGHE
ncbi:MAG: hydrogenase maturation protease [Gammaproteobacteria bacterium]|nr:hydrogenase maturation protease [Gammaproteobacteria bacterium]